MVTTYIIPAGNLVAVRAKLQQVADENNLTGILGMFTTGLSRSGTGNATHYVSSGLMSADEESWLEGNLPRSLDIYKGTNPETGAAWTPWEAFDEKGLRIVQADMA
jgi:hypothetical protein